MRKRSFDTRSALVLGGDGFIGRHLVAALACSANFDRLVVAGSNVADGESERAITSHEGDVDLRMLQNCPEPDVIFWAIGGASVGESIKDPERDFSRSVPPLVALLEMLRGPWNGAQLVFVSSAAVYGKFGSSATSITTPLAPISPYGRNKLVSEELILAAVGKGDARATIVRPFSVYGPGLRRQLYWDALAKHERGEYRFDGTGCELRDWVYIEDLAPLLIDAGLFPERFAAVLNAGTGVGMTVAATLSHLFALLPGARTPVFNGSSRPGDPDFLVACAAEQQGLASYFRTPFEEGIQRYLAWRNAIPA